MEPPGKLDREFFTSRILSRTGARHDVDVVPPANGVDVGIIRIGDGRVLSITTDPFYFDPIFGYEDSAWFAYHILASDLLTSGANPDYMTVDLNLPLSMTDDEIERMWSAFTSEASKFGTSIITGHTARYAGTSFPMIGGITAMGFIGEDEYVTSSMAEPGDRIVLTKSPGIEAAALLTRLFPETIKSRLGEDSYSYGFGLFRKLTTVYESKVARNVGLRSRVTAMHDVTEGGLLGALFEIADSSGNGIRVYEESIHVDDYIDDLCSIFGIDPLKAISEGALLMTVRENFAQDLISALKGEGIEASIIGEMTDDKKERILTGKEKKLIGPPEKDPFWAAVEYGMKKGWK
ncbi:AIR synthase [Thermoplasma sp. Kam2015]|uniref:AIR synthase family protein n=1 Tax=Thermoplasma sp. Kam2015 TaxID=2094122 RepID=UPI000D8E13E8|nr:AIR synthase-related protein [Thermoplasma sp. Kam2015]PYB67730.1 AIR synthase [Thermoplasma sp. Kam2015]